MSAENRYTESELSIILQALNIITVQGKDARPFAKLMDKVENELNELRSSKLPTEKQLKK
jgi:hypothetical protein